MSQSQALAFDKHVIMLDMTLCYVTYEYLLVPIYICKQKMSYGAQN